jgi:hypothetical protein
VNLDEAGARFKIIAAGIEKRVDETVRKVAIQALQGVVLATPVDTGRARGNWLVSLGYATKVPISRLDKGGGSAIADGRATIAQRREGQDVYLTNNVAYIGRLNEGYSAQAPAQFVQTAVAQAVAVIRGARLLP